MRNSSYMYNRWRATCLLVARTAHPLQCLNDYSSDVSHLIFFLSKHAADFIRIVM